MSKRKNRPSVPVGRHTPAPPLHAPLKRLDQSPRPEAGYPRAPEHEQFEEQLHHSAHAEEDEVDQDAPTVRNPPVVGTGHP
jgi:hypothetical protein